MELTFDGGGWWPYVVVFLAAATPVLEVLVVIPAGVLAGLSPAPTAIIALAGNLSTVALVAVGAGDSPASTPAGMTTRTSSTGVAAARNTTT